MTLPNKADDKVLKSLKASQRWDQTDADSPQQSEHFSFNAQVWLWSGGENKGSWFFVTLPEDLGQKIRKRFNNTHASRNGLIRAEVQIGQTVWKTSLLWHNPTNSYLVALKAAVRKAEALDKGDDVTVQFKILPLGTK